jgi:hypothetical protein
MYCPNCGTKTSKDQHYCRACGLGLEKIALTVAEQLPTKVDPGLQAQKERLEKLGVAALSVFALGSLGFVLYLIIQKIISKGDLLTVFGMLGFLIMVVCGLASVFLFAKAKDVSEKSTKRQQQNLASDNQTKELLSEGHFEPVPTVTERTTELLTVEKRDTNRH